MITGPVACDARVYLRPERFLDSPIGRDGAFARLAGGLQYHAGYELIVVEDGRRVQRVALDIAQLPDVIAALPDTHAEAVSRTAARLAAPRAPITLGERTIRFDQPQVMGILNLTPDSFSDGGAHLGDPDAAAAAGVRMAEAGAAIVDVGGESTRPGAATVWEGDEIERTVPVVERLARAGVAISIDTRKAAVMEAALAAGAGLINDVAALLWDDRALEVVVQARCPVVLMHSPNPKSGPHSEMPTGDPLIETYDWLEARVEAVVAAGVSRDRILIDPGIGFGKPLAANLAILNGLALFQGLGCPLLLGASRKRMIGALSSEAPANERLGGSITLALKGAEAGAQMLRVHDVADTVQALRVWRGLRDAALTAV
ncbi:dihydropteroate synthase [Sphingomonas gilva]|uniref:dihydropteroate synthase n=1 Tax=Sphingomonas gilva TaxID=2305907 RepID=A0A396RP71_9SPHN|nr:dihydropteroate synthase [Sphingomonas gilva]RHW17596.1 dihydropteroate synthase [Sphingomonas gilva]